MALDPTLTPAGRTGRSAARLGAIAWGVLAVAGTLLGLGYSLGDPVSAQACTGAGRIALGITSIVAVWGLMIAANAATLVIPGTPPDPGRIWVHAALGSCGTPLLAVVAYVVYVSAKAPY